MRNQHRFGRHDSNKIPHRDYNKDLQPQPYEDHGGLSVPILPMAAFRRCRRRHCQHHGRQLIITEIDVASSDTVQHGMHHGLSRRISAVAYKERLRNTYFGLETAFTTDEIVAFLASLHPTQSQESLLETLVRCNGSIEQAKEVLAEEARANAPKVFVDLTLSSPVIKPENLDVSRNVNHHARTGSLGNCSSPCLTMFLHAFSDCTMGPSNLQE